MKSISPSQLIILLICTLVLGFVMHDVVHPSRPVSGKTDSLSVMYPVARLLPSTKDSLLQENKTSDYLLPVMIGLDSLDSCKRPALKTNPGQMYVLNCLRDGKMYAIWCGENFIIPREKK